MSTDVQQFLRLEVERDPEPGELINLVQNPSGDLGAWFWETPVAGSAMRTFRYASRSVLLYFSPGGVESYFYSNPMPVEAGQYVSARWLAASVDGKYDVTIEWLDVDRAVIGSTATSAQYGASTEARAYGSFAVPSGTLYCRLRFEHYDAAAGHPGANSTITLRDVVLTAAATPGDLGWSRTNLVRNPSAEGGTTYWAAENGVLDVSSAQAHTGAKSFRVTKDDGKTGPMVARTTLDAVPGRDYALQVNCRPGAVARKVTLAARWLDSAGKQISQVNVKSDTEALGIWAYPLSGVVTAPTSAAKLQLRITWAQVPEGERHFFDAVLVEQASTVGSYFDGDSTDVFGVTHAWNGTPGLSTSTQTGPTGDPGVLVPVPYQNILGPTSTITIDREELNVGSMSVKLFDAVLDPTQSDLIQMGRRIRLVATPAADESESPDQQVLFAGKIFTGSVTYHLLHPDAAKRAEVTLTAVDPINALASTPQREGVATIPELPHVLEGAGVPWSVNGFGGQVADPVVVAYNDNASALDQVAVTRDSALGYAWVDRNGVLQAWDRDLLDTTVAAELDEDDYTADLNIDFDLETLINSVTVKVLRVIATTGATEEVAFGPYVHAESFRKYGERAQEYVVQGLDASDTAGIQEYAEAILAANALPRLRVNEMALPVAGSGIEEPRLDCALLDLYDLVGVSNERAGIDEDARVRRIRHEITATSSGAKWLMTLGFTADGVVAPSTAVPSPPPGVGEVKDEFDETLAELNADLTELNDVTLPQVAADLAQLNTDLSTLNGLFPITSTSISDGAITTPKMTANSINGDRILANSLNASKIVANSITGDKIQANSIGANHIVANSIGTDELAANAVTAGKIAAGAITAVAASGGGVTATLSGSTGPAGNAALSFSGSGFSHALYSSSGTLTLYSNNSLTVTAPTVEVYGQITMSADVTFAGTLPTADAAPNLRIGNDGKLYKNSNMSLGPNDSAGTGYRVVRVPN